MPRARYILSAARAATVGLLMVVCLFLGPVSVSAAGPDAGDDACPCEAKHDEHDEHDCGDGQPADSYEYEHGTPPDEERPED